MITVKQLLLSQKPEITLLKQPCVSDYQVWYTSDLKGRKAPMIQGKSKNTPSLIIKIPGYTGKAYVCLSAVTATEKDKGKGNFMPHPFKVVSNADPKSNERGFTILKTNVDPLGTLKIDLGIVGVTNKRIARWLKIREKEKVDPFKTGFGHNIEDLLTIRIAIQVFTVFHVLNPIVTEPLPLKVAKQLKIRYMTPLEGSCRGGTQITILCDKVDENDVIVEFFHERSGWKDIGKISDDPGIYHQVVIVLESPPYLDKMISKTEVVKVQLRRPSDGQTSNSLEFRMLPESDSDKRKRVDWSGNLGTISRLMENENKKRFKESVTLKPNLTNEIKTNLSTEKFMMKKKLASMDDSKEYLYPKIMPGLLDIPQILNGAHPFDQTWNEKSHDEYIVPDIDLDFLIDS